MQENKIGKRREGRINETKRKKYEEKWKGRENARAKTKQEIGEEGGEEEEELNMHETKMKRVWKKQKKAGMKKKSESRGREEIRNAEGDKKNVETSGGMEEE